MEKKDDVSKKKITSGKVTVPNLDINWDADKPEESLRNAYKEVIERTQKINTAYFNKFKKFSRKAKYLRTAEIFLGTAASVWLLLSSFLLDDGRPILPPVWAGVVLLVVGGLVLCDRFYGYTSSWMRFSLTQCKLNNLLVQFQIEWVELKAGCCNGESSLSFICKCLSRLKEFAIAVENVRLEETREWTVELGSAIKAIDKWMSEIEDNKPQV